MKYIVIGNTAQWCYYSWYEEIKNKRITFINDIVPFAGNNTLKHICCLHYSQKLNKKFSFPLKKIWYKNITKALGIDSNEEATLIIYDWSRISSDLAFIIYLKKRYPLLTIVYLFSNIVEHSGAKMYGIINKLCRYYDIVFAFDKQDANKYHFEYHPLIYTGINSKDKCREDYDLYYVGQAKDKHRYETLIEIYEKAISEGLKCNFNIVGVEPDCQKYSETIHFNRYLDYSDVVNDIKRSKCLVDVVQENAVGLTIKTCESLAYNKKLITTNSSVIEESFFSEEMIMIHPSEENIKDFLLKKSSFDPNNSDYFSPQRLFKQIKTIKRNLNK